MAVCFGIGKANTVPHNHYLNEQLTFETRQGVRSDNSICTRDRAGKQPVHTPLAVSIRLISPIETDENIFRLPE